jgi:hypothetical protein
MAPVLEQAADDLGTGAFRKKSLVIQGYIYPETGRQGAHPPIRGDFGAGISCLSLPCRQQQKPNAQH